MTISAEDVQQQLDKKIEVGFGQETTDGDPAYIRLNKGGIEIYLTAAQARSVASQITMKLSGDRPENEQPNRRTKG